MAEPLGDLARTHYCGELRESHVGKTVTLMGWAATRRDLGGVVFVDLRDREGICQVVARPEVSKDAHAAADKVRSEYVVAVTGAVHARSEDTVNPNLDTGKVEVLAEEIRILSEAKTPVFPIEDEVDTNEETRLKYRYLDLRRPRLQRNVKLRHQVTFEVRRYLDEQGFYEIETPMLAKSTPEGARDYLVPSRVHHGQLLRAAAVAAALQAAADDLGARPLLPDRALLPRRGPARRPPARVHAGRHRDVVPAPAEHHRPRRASVPARDGRDRREGRAPVPAARLCRGAAALRQRQARPALRHGDHGRERRARGARARRLPEAARGGGQSTRDRAAGRLRCVRNAAAQDQRGALARAHRARRPRREAQAC